VECTCVRDDSDSGQLTDCNKTLVEFVVGTLYYELAARGEAKAFKRLATQLIDPLEVPKGLSNPHIFRNVARVYTNSNYINKPLTRLFWREMETGPQHWR